MKYRKKPVVIEAEVWSGKDWDLSKYPGVSFSFNTLEEGGPFLYIHTLEGIMKASPGDYVVKGIKGECYPVKPDIFEMTYEKVAD
jgi:hypothetical protein